MWYFNVHQIDAQVDAQFINEPHEHVLESRRIADVNEERVVIVVRQVELVDEALAGSTAE